MRTESIVDWARELPESKNKWSADQKIFFIDGNYRWLPYHLTGLEKPQSRAATTYWISL